MTSLVEDIYTFNQEAGLLGKGMDSFKEMAYTLEECFEGFEGAYNTLDKDGNPFKPGDMEYPTSRQLGLSLANSLKDGMDIHKLPDIPEVGELDKSIDIVVYNIGKIAKMGLTVEEIYEAFAVVSEANLAKLNGPKDEHGKQLKPEGWVPPEDKLQLILDSRKGIING